MFYAEFIVFPLSPIQLVKDGVPQCMYKKNRDSSLVCIYGAMIVIFSWSRLRGNVKHPEMLVSIPSNHLGKTPSRIWALRVFYAIPAAQHCTTDPQFFIYATYIICVLHGSQYKILNARYPSTVKKL